MNLAVQQGESAPRRSDAQATRRFLAPAFVTVASVGVGVMGNYLQSPQQVLGFLVLVVLGLVGLAMTWARNT